MTSIGLMETTTTITSLGSILVVGGTGLVGSRIVSSFLEDPQFSSIHVLSRNTPSNSFDNVNYHTGDIVNEEVVQKVIEKVQPRIIVHCVAPSHTANKQTQQRIILGGTSNVLKYALASSSVEALIYTSTCQVVKQTGVELTEETGQVITEADNASPYVKCKALAETMVLKENGKSLRTVSLRITGLYGEGNGSLTEMQVQRMRKGEHKFQIGDNSALWAFIYVADAALAHVLAAKALLREGEAPDTPKVDGEAFFVTDGTATPFWDICREIWKEAGDNTPLEKVTVIPLFPMLIFASIGEWLFWAFTFGKKEPELRRYDLEFLKTGCFVSIQKARERLGFEPRFGRIEGIRRGVKWALEQESRKNT